MVVEQDLLTFFEWLLPTEHGPGGLITFVVLSVILMVFGLVCAYVISAARNGPTEGFYRVARGIGMGVSDLIGTRPRRVLAMAMLAMKEAIRRRVLVAFAAFMVVLLFAGWFLDVKSDNPAQVYISVVLGMTNYLVLLLALFLSAFSLPADIKNRTIYTIVTKPVRATEIVLGRVLGFMAIGTVLLAVMCVVSYIFVIRGLNHRHTVDMSDFRAVAAAGESGDPTPAGDVRVGESSYNAHHRHVITIEDGEAFVEAQTGHTHEATILPDGSVELGPPIGQLQARVPVYGDLAFLDRTGQPGEGISVGKEWTYRSYIEGGSQAAAWWTFKNISPERFPDGLPIEMTIGVFRTHKGDIERGVIGEIFLKHPERNVTSALETFVSREYETDQHFFPVTLDIVDRDTGVTQHDANLFENLVSDDGRLEIWMRCAERGQYFGMAKADVYLRAAEQPFFWNFAKGYWSLWLQMLMVTSFGVMFSTFLSGAVAMLATLSTMVLGYFQTFVVAVATGELEGGGPFQSMVRIVTQANLSTPLDIDPNAVRTLGFFDIVMMQVMQGVSYILPRYRDMGTSQFVAYGFNIHGDLLAAHTATALAYFLAVSVVAYFSLRSRELAA